MGWQLEKLISDIANSKSVNAIFNNPIYTAVIIVSIMLIIIWFVFGDEVELYEDSSFSMGGLMFTTASYSLLAVMPIVYLQHRAMQNDFESRYSNKRQNAVVDAALEPIIGEGEFEEVDIYNPSPALYEEMEGDEEENYAAESSDSSSVDVPDSEVKSDE